MAFRGNVAPGSEVEAELQLDAASKGTALLAIAYSCNEGGQESDSTSVAPGGAGQAKVKTDPAQNGLLKVWVDTKTDADQGELIVRVSGAIRDNGHISGDVIWTYTVS